MSSMIKSNLKYLVLLVLTIIIFILLGKYYGKEIHDFDMKVFEFLNNYIKDGYTTFFKYFTYMGSALILICVVVLMFFNNKKGSLYLICNLAFTYLTSVVVKNIFLRERPTTNLIKLPSDYSFPSGHTMCSFALYGLVFYLLTRSIKNSFLRILLFIIIFSTILLIGLSRLYLQVHFFSDVLGGCILGFICLLMFINIYKKEEIK